MPEAQRGSGGTRLLRMPGCGMLWTLVLLQGEAQGTGETPVPLSSAVRRLQESVCPLGLPLS